MVVDDGSMTPYDVIASQEEGRSRLQALRLFNDMFGLDPSSTLSRDELRDLLSSALLASEHIEETSFGDG